MQIHYEPHPVSRERKAELVAAGLKIIDARFAPVDAVPVQFPPEAAEAQPKRGRPRKGA
jgi:hypothetical protein